MTNDKSCWNRFLQYAASPFLGQQMFLSININLEPTTLSLPAVALSVLSVVIHLMKSSCLMCINTLNAAFVFCFTWNNLYFHICAHLHLQFEVHLLYLSTCICYFIPLLHYISKWNIVLSTSLHVFDSHHYYIQRFDKCIKSDTFLQSKLPNSISSSTSTCYNIKILITH